MEDHHVVLSYIIYIYVFICIYIYYVEGSQEGSVLSKNFTLFVDFQSISMWLIVIDYQKVPTATLQEYEDWQM